MPEKLSRIGEMAAETDSPRLALTEAILAVGSRPALMQKLNERGHDIKSPGVIGQWLISGVPAQYAPDIEALTGVFCERLCPKVKWGLVRDRRARRQSGHCSTDAKAA